ncbi:hypothetical protein ATKI12_8904 [Kitasatospora sp. Ki12]
MPARTPEPDPGPPIHGSREQRAATVRRLLHLKAEGTLNPSHLQTAADLYDVHQRTVQRWMNNAASHNGTYSPQGRRRFTLTEEMQEILAAWHGNITSTYHEIYGYDHSQQEISLATFHRAVTRELSPGWLAGLRHGENARRRYDVHNTRERGHRNQAWEADHVKLDVEVLLDGRRCNPWLTAIIDASTTSHGRGPHPPTPPTAARSCSPCAAPCYPTNRSPSPALPA